MSVDDWARREAEREYGEGHTDPEGYGFEAGIVHAFDAFLSDEAVGAAAELFYTIQTGTVGKYHTSTYKETWDASARAALRAAIAAVTERAE